MEVVKCRKFIHLMIMMYKGAQWVRCRWNLTRPNPIGKGLGIK